MDIDKDRLRKAIEKRLSQRQIAMGFNVSQATICRLIKRYNLPPTNCKSGPPREGIRALCLYCGKKTKNRFYCSVAHRQAATDGEIETADDFTGFGRRRVRRYLINLCDNTCAICENSMWMGKPIPMVMDHIDGNPENNGRENLRMICSNCDAQLPTYKSRNYGNGRHFRRKRYAEGRSY